MSVLVLSNTQGELSVLERRKHDRSINAYAEMVGRSQQTANDMQRLAAIPSPM